MQLGSILAHKRLFLLQVVVGVSISASAQKNEYKALVGLGMLQNSNAVTGSGNMLEVKNTFAPSLGIERSRITKHSFILSEGVAVGYEQYKSTIDYPFETYHFIRPANMDKYNANNIIPYVEVNVNVGYRFTMLSKFTPEIRIGQVLRLPLATRTFHYNSVESRTSGAEQENFDTYGYLGRAGSGFPMEALNYVYVGVNHTYGKKMFSAGIKLQKDLLESSVTSIDVTGYGDYHEHISSQTFYGRHSTISLVLGMNL
jgi:hypothetical protein